MPRHNVVVMKRMLAAQRDAILEPYAEEIIRRQKKLDFNVVEWLRKKGMDCREEDVRRFFMARRLRLKHDHVLNKLKEAANMCRAVQEAMDKNPPPTLEALMKVHHLLIFKLSTQEHVDPKVIMLVDQLTRTAIYYEMDKKKFEQREKFIDLAQKRLEMQSGEGRETQAIVTSERLALGEGAQAQKIAEMRKAAFVDVEELQQSGELKIPAG